MATLSDLAKRVRNTVSRQSQAFLRVETWDATNSEKDYTFVNIGRIKNSSFNASPITSEADQDGRESSQLWDITVSFTLMQASNEELSLLSDLAMPESGTNDLYLNGHTVYFSGTNQLSTSELNASLTDDDLAGEGANEATPDFSTLNDPDGLLFVNVLLKPSAEISLNSEVSLLPVEFTGRVALDEFKDIDTTQTITISPE